MHTQNLPDEYKSDLDYSTNFSYTDYNVSELIDVCEKLVRDAVVSLNYLSITI